MCNVFAKNTLIGDWKKRLIPALRNKKARAICFSFLPLN